MASMKETPRNTPDPTQISELRLPASAARVLQDYASRYRSSAPFLALLFGGPGSGKTTTLRLAEEFARREGALAVYLNTDELGSVRLLGPPLAAAALAALERDFTSDSELHGPLQSASRGAIRGVSQLVRLLREAAPKRGPRPHRVLVLIDGVRHLEPTNSFELDELVSEFIRPESRSLDEGVCVDLMMASDGDVPRLPRTIRRYELVLTENELARRWDELGVKALGTHLFGLPREEFLEVVEGYLRDEDRPDIVLGVLAATWRRFGSGADFGVLLEASLTPEEQRLLRLVVLLQPVEYSYLETLIDSLAAVVQSVDRKGIFVRSATKLSALEPIGSALIAKTLAEVRIDLTDLAFGSAEAETDRHLDEVQVDNRQARRVMKGERSIVIGDRGSGKSAVYRQLLRSQGAAGVAWRVIGETEPGRFVQRMTVDEMPVASADHFRAVWLAYAAALVAMDLLKDAKSPRADKEIRRSAYRLLRSVGWDDRVAANVPWAIRAYEATRSFVSAGIKLSIGPVTLEPNVGKTPRRRGRDEIDIDAFLLQADSKLQSSGESLWAAADRIDELYKYDRPKQEPLVQGILLAESRVAQLSSIRLAPFIRTDLFELYDLQEKNKSRQRRVHISWKEDRLRQLLLRRVYANRALDQLASMFDVDPQGTPIHQEVALALLFPRLVEEKPFFVWLIEILQNGRGRVAPRQIVLFLNDLIDSVEDQPIARLPVFGQNAIIAAVRSVSRMSFEEVVSDFRVAVGFVESCRAGRFRRFSLQQVEDLFDSSEGTSVEQVNQLERLGFARRRVAVEDGQVAVEFEIPRLYWEHWEDLGS